MEEGSDLDIVSAESLVEDVLRGDRAKWTALVAMLHPALLRFARQCRSLGYRRSDEDAPREVAVLVLERLRKNDFRALRTYVAWKTSNASKTLEDWLRIVIDRVSCDFVSKRVRRALVDTLVTALDSRAPMAPFMTDAQAVREVLEHAQRDLPPDQAFVVRRVFEGAGIDEIAAETSCDADAVQRTLRAAYARLRRWVDENGNAS